MAAAGQDPGVLTTWQTSSRVTAFLIENVPDEVWRSTIPGAPRRTVQMIGGHLHNCRCMWVQMLGKRHGLAVPRRVDRHRVSRRQLLAALAQSARAIGELLEVGLANGGHLAGFSPPEVTHFLAYHVAHEGHHRGQIVMVARQLGHRLPAEVANGLWQWAKRAREARRDA
jgi:uncharacterized damage-inducible protein DinB